MALPSCYVYWVRSRRGSTIENGNPLFFPKSIFQFSKNFLEAGNYPPGFGRVLVPVFWFPCSGSRVLVPVFWFPCSDSRVLVPVFWFPCSGSPTMVPVFWFPCSDSPTGFKILFVGGDLN
jgi:hypothetical protein